MNKLRIYGSVILALILCAFLTVVVLLLVYVHTAIIIAFVAITIFLLDIIFSLWIINSKRNTNIKLCWIFFVCVLPLIGCIAFMIFGTQPFTMKNIDSFHKSWIVCSKKEDYTYTRKLYDNKKLDHIFAYNLSLSYSPVYINNKIEIIQHLPKMYDISIELIRKAKKTIYIQTYIINDGIWLRTIATELIKKAKEGVSIFFMYDWVGSYQKPYKSIIKQLKKSGVHVAIFNPKGLNMFKSLTNYRSHQKAIIIDNNECLYGGSNLSDEYLSISKRKNFWHDLNFIVSGEIVNSMSINFIHGWINFSNYVSKYSKNKKIVNKNLCKSINFPKNKHNFKCEMQFIRSAPDYEKKLIEQTIIQLINQAQKTVKIVTPYFYPSNEVFNTIINAGLRGINVELIFPRLSDDKKFVITTNRSSYGELNNAGCSIYEYNGFIHSKYMIIDNEYVLTGSYNLDYRSLWINFENSLIIKNKQFANEMNKNAFKNDLSKSIKITKNDIKSFNTKKSRFINKCINLIHPLI